MKNKSRAIFQSIVILTSCLGTFTIARGGDIPEPRKALKTYCSQKLMRKWARVTDIPYLVPASITSTFEPQELEMLRAQVERIFSDPDLTIQQKARQSFEVYLEARVRDLPLEAKQSASTYFRDAYLVSENGNYLTNRIVAQIPADAYDDIYILSVIAHEVEHNIHFFDAWDPRSPKGAGPLKILKTIYQNILSPRSIYVSEAGAMKAEWEFMQLIPDSELLKAVSRLKASSLPETDKKYLEAVLVSSRLPLKDYLENQRGILRNEGAFTFLANKGVTALFVLSIVYRKYCEYYPEAKVCPVK